VAEGIQSRPPGGGKGTDSRKYRQEGNAQL
jgi:hypothetical protein